MGDSVLTCKIVTPDKDSTWAQTAAEKILQAVDKWIQSKGSCTLMLAGGTTVRDMYSLWAEVYDFPHHNIRYFFGDERCVPPEHAESNYGQALQTLFRGEPNHAIDLYRMEGEASDCDAAAVRYDSILPDVIDVMLLGMGEDGHIASLFAGSHALLESNRRVMAVSGPKPPSRRLTVTPPVIAAAKQTFLLAKGKNKGKKLSEALQHPRDYMKIPVCLAVHATWILDDAAAACICSYQS